jgi:hypothetical protein
MLELSQQDSRLEPSIGNEVHAVNRWNRKFTFIGSEGSDRK